MTTTVRRTRAVELLWKAHAFLYRVSGGRLGARLGALPLLLFTVKGRRSGEPRTVALNYVEDGGRYTVYASHAGEDLDPPWWLNLRAAGEADVQIGSHTVAREKPKATSASVSGSA